MLQYEADIASDPLHRRRLDTEVKLAHLGPAYDIDLKLISAHVQNGKSRKYNFGW